MVKSNNSGFIHLTLILLFVTLILVFSFVNSKIFFKNSSLDRSVLSESTESNDEDNDKEDEVEEEDETSEIEDVDEDKQENDSPTQKPAVKEKESNDDLDETDENNNNNDANNNNDDEDDGNKLELENENNLKLKIKLKSNGNEFEYESEGENVKVQSNLPLSIDPETNKLFIGSSTGQKEITILPTQVFEDIINNEKLTLVNSTSISENENGELEYQIEGQDEEKLLGIFNVKIHKIYTVSATNGQETANYSDILNKILDLLSV